jgi:hypothetical protein
LVSHDEEFLGFLSLNDGEPIAGLDLADSAVGSGYVFKVFSGPYSLFSDFTPLINFVDRSANGMGVADIKVLDGVAFFDGLLVK